MSGVTSITEYVAGLTLDQFARAVAALEALPEAARRRPQTSMVFCKKLRLEGTWGVVKLGDIVHRTHAAVAGNEEWFEATSIGHDPELEEELAIRNRRVAELTNGGSHPRPQAGRVARAPSITPASPPASTTARTKTTRYPWKVEFRPDVRPRNTIRLTYEGCRTIEANAALVAPAGVETGGYGWTHGPTPIHGRDVVVDYASASRIGSGRRSGTRGPAAPVTRRWSSTTRSSTGRSALLRSRRQA
jgi:hypothetical protein